MICLHLRIQPHSEGSEKQEMPVGSKPRNCMVTAQVEDGL